VDDGFRFSVISAFAGCGGSSLGYKLAGGEVRLAIDSDASAVATYRGNFPETAIYHGDIENLNVEECVRLSQVQPEELDVLDASPPCQGFSALGKRRFEDRRNELVWEVIRLLRGLRPKTCILENVSGMVRGEMKLIFSDALRDMKRAGYAVKARVLDAQYFGVPQRRKRIIMLGVRDDLGVEPSFPRAQSGPQSVRQALGLLGDGGIKSNNQFRSGHSWRSLDEPCTTLTRHPPILLLDGQRRELTVEECSIIGGFPREWQWGNGAFRLIANAVPPLFMRAVAEHVRDKILGVVNIDLPVPPRRTAIQVRRVGPAVREARTAHDVTAQ
jgi:DNA (cytosine-5)-methyltransferase 1